MFTQRPCCGEENTEVSETAMAVRCQNHNLTLRLPVASLRSDFSILYPVDPKAELSIER